MPRLVYAPAAEDGGLRLKAKCKAKRILWLVGESVKGGVCLHGASYAFVTQVNIDHTGFVPADEGASARQCVFMYAGRQLTTMAGTNTRSPRRSISPRGR